MKLTPFARFMLVMIFAAPLAFLAASYYNGKDGILELKKLLGIEQRAEQPSTNTTAPAPGATANPAESAPVTQQPASTDTNYAALKQENEDLRDLLSQKELEIQQLKKELNRLKGTQGQ